MVRAAGSRAQPLRLRVCESCECAVLSITGLHRVVLFITGGSSGEFCGRCQETESSCSLWADPPQIIHIDGDEEHVEGFSEKFYWFAIMPPVTQNSLQILVSDKRGWKAETVLGRKMQSCRRISVWPRRAMPRCNNPPAVDPGKKLAAAASCTKLRIPRGSRQQRRLAESRHCRHIC